MDKTRKKLVKILTLIFLVLFPFGQLLRYEVLLFGTNVTFHPIDLIVGFIFLILITGGYDKPTIYKSILAFLSVAVFSLFFSATIFGITPIIKGSFYLLRLTSYLFFFVALINIVRTSVAKNMLYKTLILISAIVGIFGWIQYLWLPDLRSLYFIGWDDHLYRLIGTFLDPGFTSIILVFGFLLSLVKFLEEKKKRYIVFLLFFLVTTAFTYARAAYIALLTGTYVISKVKKSLKTVLAVSALLLLIILVLPRPEGYGVKLERTHSIYAKIVNYKETLSIIKESPLIGIGFNNVCIARQKYLGDEKSLSHACSGSDSSLLTIFATSGVLGLITIVKFSYELIVMRRKAYNLAFLGCFAALIVHSIFVNSLVYPWVMGFMAILSATRG